MKKIILLASCATLWACADTAEAPVENETVMDETAMAEPEEMTLAGTTWEFTRDGVTYIESIDNEGNYIADTADGEHADHGTYEMVDGKACFTSAMTDEGTICWTVSDVEIDGSMETTSDQGETLTVTRRAYTELAMPAG